MHVAGESRDHQVLVDGGDDPRRHGIAGIHQQFEPFAEALLVEPCVAPRRRGAPQIEVEEGRHLLRGRRGDELSAGVEAAVANELMQGFGRNVRHDPREEGCVEQARESMVDRTGARNRISRAHGRGGAG